MSLGTSNRDGGKTSEAGHLRAIYKGIIGEVLQGLAVSQRGAGANMSVDIAVGDAILPRSDATYGHPVFNDAVLNKTVTTADPSNPRRDIVIMYLDYTVTPSTGVSNNTNSVVLTKVVAGTPAGSPADPSDAALQSAAGSGNPYIKLARLRVGAGVTSIGNSVIDDLRAIATGDISGGWKNAGTALALWAFSSFSSTTRIGVITVPTDITTRVSVGMKVKVWQLTGGWKYGFVVGATATTLTVFFGTAYTLNNEAIYLPSYSMDSVPYGYDGPQLQRETYYNKGSTVVRWVFEQSGWHGEVGTAASATTLANKTFPVPYPTAPTFVISTLGYSPTNPTAPSDANSTAGFYFVGSPLSNGTGYSPSILSRDAGSNNNTSTYYMHSWIARGVVV